MTTPPSPSVETTEPIIRAEGIVKRFGKETVALDGVSISIMPGTIYGLLGPNGAGKTTLIRVLTTLLDPDAGNAWIDGVDVVADPVTARTKIGLAGQSAAIDGFLTGRENVEMIGRLYGLPATQARARANDVLRRIDLLDAADRQVKTYSGGMRRRLDLAASLVGEPEVLFLDEPTTGIDPRSRLDIWDIIRDLVAGGTTLLMTTQYLEEVDYLADCIGVIDRGKLIAEGTAGELKARIGSTVIEVRVPDDERERAIALLRDVSHEEPMFEPNRGCLVVHAPEGSRTMMEVVRRLNEAGLTPDDLEMHKPTLDEVFLTLTGRVTESAAKAEGEGQAPAGGRARFGRRRPR
jgi:ABC-2 type transport system ATP-binding protein